MLIVNISETVRDRDKVQGAPVGTYGLLKRVTLNNLE